jgi:hypothetical protein
VEATRFELLTRAIASQLTRRRLASVLGLAGTTFPALVAAKKKRKRSKKVRRNDFGCVNVGSFCKNAGQCCSGICQGKKGKKTCKAHDQSTCQAGQSAEVCGGTNVFCTPSGGGVGACVTTTGNAGYCEASGECFPCSTDADCVPFCGPQAACIVCEALCFPLGLRTACVGPVVDSCTFPPP